ncbi:MAG: DUF192 domain-containing protein [Candidatus Brocadiales bacterium]
MRDMTSNLNKRVLVVLAAVLIVLIAYRYLVSGNDLTRISVGGKEVYVELAASEEKRNLGLQFRTYLEEDHGMLFIFPTEGRHAFWMKDTHIPLSIAFIKENGAITQIEEMEPDSLEHHTSREKVKYALEMEGGWFERNNVHAGDPVTIP